VYGLEASAGVNAELLARKNYDTDWNNIAIVSGAVIFDFNRFRINKAVYPDKALGRAALVAAKPNVFPLGARGAGVCATVGKWLREPYELERSGQGAAVYESGDVRVAAFTVVNAVGCLVDRHGAAVRGHIDPKTGRRHRVGEVVSVRSELAPEPEVPPGNTTLTVIVTNQVMGIRELNQMARQVHSSMARAIDPFHTMYDGDVLYCVTTNQIDPAPLKYNEVSYSRLGAGVGRGAELVLAFLRSGSRLFGRLAGDAVTLLDHLVGLESAAQRLVELHEGAQFVAARLRLQKLRLEELALRIEHFDV
jgi:L-aminopeptidase/D-esterase-like protein